MGNFIEDDRENVPDNPDFWDLILYINGREWFQTVTEGKQGAIQGQDEHSMLVSFLRIF